MRYWTQPVDQRFETIQDLAQAVANAVSGLIDGTVAPELRGLYVATGDAGIDVSVKFWAEALVETPRFASPVDFPWTLTNAPAGFLARALSVRGPNYTMVGDGDAALAALEHACDDLQCGRVSEALIIACDLAGPMQAVAIVSRHIGTLPGAVKVGATAAELLAEICIDGGGCDCSDLAVSAGKCGH